MIAVKNNCTKVSVGRSFREGVSLKCQLVKALLLSDFNKVTFVQHKAEGTPNFGSLDTWGNYVQKAH